MIDFDKVWKDANEQYEAITGYSIGPRSTKIAVAALVAAINNEFSRCNLCNHREPEESDAG